MIFFSELQMQGDKHVNVNSSLLNIIKDSFPNEIISLICDDFHYSEISKYIINKDTIEKYLFPYTGSKELRKVFIPHKVLRECFLIYKVYQLAKLNNSKCVIFASVFPFTGVFLNLVSFIFKQKTLVALHGDIGVLKIKRKKITTSLFKSSIKHFLKYRSKHIRLIIYGETIAIELAQLNKKYIRKNDILIDHPCNFDAIFEKESNNTKIVISNIGVGIINKNSQNIFELANALSAEITNHKLEFKQIGNISKEVLKYQNQYVTILNNNHFLPFEIFKQNIINSNYFIFFFKKNTLYDLCPSGTFFDAIKYEKPIIAFKTSYFEYYFKKLGNIGYLCDDLNEMESVIKKILNSNTNEYSVQVANLKKAKELLSHKNILQSFNYQYHFHN
jgi:hypothetical protein